MILDSHWERSMNGTTLGGWPLVFGGVLNDARDKIFLKEEVDANIKILSGDATYTLDDRALLAEFSVKALDRGPLKAMRVD